MKRGMQGAGLVAVWIALFAAFSAAMPETFASSRNLETIFRQTIIVGFAAIGMTLIIITGAIDLSVGSLVALVTVVTALVIKSSGDPLLAGLAAVACGILAGAANGAMVSKLKIGSFIVTLATLLALRGIAKGAAGEKTVPVPITWLSELTSSLPLERKWTLLPIGGWLVIGFAILAWVLLKKTVFGRHIVAVGSNRAAAQMCGIPSARVQWIVFVIAGFFFGLAGLMQFSRLTVGDPTVAAGLELSVIAAVVIGGASLTGGEGSLFGSLIGALIMTTIATGASQLGWPNWVQEIVTGAIILAAVAFDRWRSARVAASES